MQVDSNIQVFSDAKFTVPQSVEEYEQLKRQIEDIEDKTDVGTAAISLTPNVGGLITLGTTILSTKVLPSIADEMLRDYVKDFANQEIAKNKITEFEANIVTMHESFMEIQRAQQNISQHLLATYLQGIKNDIKELVNYCNHINSIFRKSPQFAYRLLVELAKIMGIVDTIQHKSLPSSEYMPWYAACKFTKVLDKYCLLTVIDRLNDVHLLPPTTYALHGKKYIPYKSVNYTGEVTSIRECPNTLYPFVRDISTGFQIAGGGNCLKAYSEYIQVSIEETSKAPIALSQNLCARALQNRETPFYAESGIIRNFVLETNIVFTFLINVC